VLIVSVTFNLLHLRITANLGRRPRLDVSLLVLLGIAVLVVSIAILMSSSLGDSTRGPDRCGGEEHVADPGTARGGRDLACQWREARRRMVSGAC